MDSGLGNPAVRRQIAAAAALGGWHGGRTADGWWLLRASNTQAVLVARAESATEDGLARLKRELAFELGASGVALPDI